MIEIETYDESGLQYIILDWQDPTWGSVYGEGGGGFTYLQFKLPRPLGHSYHDIKLGNAITVRKYLADILFHGQIRETEESTDAKGDTIVVVALGSIVISEDDELLRAYCDTDTTKWRTDTEVPFAEYRPDLHNYGSNPQGLHISANGRTQYTEGDSMLLKYEFNPDERAKRLKCELSIILGSGMVFDAEVSAIDDVNGYVDYTNDHGETYVRVGMTLVNTDRDSDAVVQAIDTGTNRITVTDPTAISSWIAGDNVYVAGPSFFGEIDLIDGSTITYAGDVGEDNLAAGYPLVNITRKGVAVIASYDTVGNTITVTDESHVAGWAQGDGIFFFGASLWYATVASVSNDGDGTGTVTYSSDIGTFLVSATTGWILYNETQDEFAEVDGWTTGSSQVHVDSWSEISGWSASDVLRIYTPFWIGIFDRTGNIYNDTLLWPPSDWRQGGVPRARYPIDITVSNPDAIGFQLYTECRVSGTANEDTFFLLSNLRVYSTADEVTAEMLAKDMVDLLSGDGHDLEDSVTDIEAMDKVLEPMVFEYVTPRDALRWACDFGDDGGNRLAWGVRLDDRRRLYLETQDLNTVDYVIQREGQLRMSKRRSVQDTWQHIRGVYTGPSGDPEYTDWRSNYDAEFGGHFRRRLLRLDSVQHEIYAVDLVDQFLAENSRPKQSARYTVEDGSVFTYYGAPVPVDELKATGRLVMIEDWRSGIDTRSISDLRDNWAVEQVTGIQVDYNSRKAEIIPANPKSTFMTMLAELARITAK